MSRKRCQIEMLLLQTTTRKLYMAYRVAAIPMTLSDLQGHSPIATVFKWNFSYSFAAVDRIDIARRAVPVQ